MDVAVLSLTDRANSARDSMSKDAMFCSSRDRAARALASCFRCGFQTPALIRAGVSDFLSFLAFFGQCVVLGKGRSRFHLDVFPSSAL